LYRWVGWGEIAVGGGGESRSIGGEPGRVILVDGSSIKDGRAQPTTS